MPINYPQIQKQIADFCELTKKHNRVIQATVRQFMDTLAQYNDHLGSLIEFVESESDSNKFLRCAKPINEALTSIHSLPVMKRAVTLIAADGSQINPSRHRQVDFCLINVATICIQTGMDLPPVIKTESTILNAYELTSDSSPLTEDILALERDIRERAALVNQACMYTQPLVTLTDGPLELFREIGGSERYEIKLAEYIGILTNLKNSRITTAGYVDKPHSDLVNRLIKLIIEKTSLTTTKTHTTSEYAWVPDAILFNNLLLSPGDRSAIFCIQSPWSEKFNEDLAPCFFYLNVSRSETPYLARVEIPAWSARNADIIDQLHAAIYRQCNIMSPRPYPYILHRAHEISLVTFEETLELDALLATELKQRGVGIGSISNKQSAKDLPGRGRFL